MTAQPMTFPEFKPLDLDVVLLTPPRKKAKTANDTNPLESSSTYSEAIIPVDEKSELDYSILNHHSNNLIEEMQVLSPPTDEHGHPTARIDEAKKQSKSVDLVSDKEISVNNDPLEDGSNRSPRKTVTNKQRVLTQDFCSQKKYDTNEQSFDHVLEETNNMLVNADACLQEMNLLSVKNAILMNALVMVGADL